MNSRRSFLKSLFGVAAAAALSIRMTPFEEEPKKSEIPLADFNNWMREFMAAGDQPKLAIVGPESYRAIMRYAGTPIHPEMGIAILRNIPLVDYAAGYHEEVKRWT